MINNQNFGPIVLRPQADFQNAQGWVGLSMRNSRDEQNEKQKKDKVSFHQQPPDVRWIYCIIQSRRAIAAPVRQKRECNGFPRPEDAAGQPLNPGADAPDVG